MSYKEGLAKLEGTTLFGGTLFAVTVKLAICY